MSHLSSGQRFGSLEIENWILFVFCNLVIEILYIHQFNDNFDIPFDFLLYGWDTTLVHMQTAIDVNNLAGNKAG
jgi:hypothetical protein